MTNLSQGELLIQMEEEVLRDEETLIIQASTLIVLLCMAASGNGVLIFMFMLRAVPLKKLIACETEQDECTFGISEP